MPREQHSQGDLSEAYITQALRARREQGALRDGEAEESYMVSFGDVDHPAWMRVWPDGGGVEIESDWTLLRVEGINRVSQRRGRLRLESMQEPELAVVELSPSGNVTVVREGTITTDDPQAETLLRRARGEIAEVERVTLRGRVGAVPRFRETPEMKRLVASFPLGVHPDMDSTAWYSVVVFGPWAKRLQEKPLAVGQEVEVVGYVHERERRTRTGDTRTEQQVYAAAVRTTLKGPPGGTSS